MKQCQLKFHVNSSKWQNFQLKYIFCIIKQLSGGETSWSNILGGETSWSETSGSDSFGFQMACDYPGYEMSRSKNTGVKRPGPKYQRAKRPGPKRQGAKRPGPKLSGGETTWSETSGCETFRSKTFGGEASWARNVQVQNVRGRNVLVQNIRGLRPGQNVRGRNVLSKSPKSEGAKRPGAKTLPEPSLHDCESFSMTLTFPEASLWLWGYFIIII